MITINNNFSVGETVYLVHNGNIISDTVKSIRVYDFSIDAKNTNVPKPRYILSNTIGKFYECELYKTPQDIIKAFQKQVKNIA